ncbi:MAG: M48 family metallopeptidase [Treponema sp.]|nr:M48 family metallopeptidase [Treponema sp.]
MSLESRSVIITDKNNIPRKLTYELERKRVKNINLRIRSDETLFVSASPVVAVNTIDDFILSKSDFILKSLNRFSEKRKWEIDNKKYVSGESFYLLGKQMRLIVKQANQNHVEEDGVYITLSCRYPDDYVLKKRLIEKFFYQRCYEEFNKIIERSYSLFKKYKVPYPNLKIRRMKTRWGSCIPSKNQITLNENLIHFSERCIESVVIHEFCHFRYPNHSKEFYNFMTILMPDWKERKKELDETVLN